MHQYHRKANRMIVDQLFVNEAVREYQHTICIMGADGGMRFISTVGVVRGDYQVVAFLSNDALDAVQERNEEVIVKVAEKKADHAGLIGCQVTCGGVRDVFQLHHHCMQSCRNLR